MENWFEINTKEQILTYLRDSTASDVANDLFVKDPWIFHNRPSDAIRFQRIAHNFGLLEDDCKMLVMGSGATGFSLSPYKLGNRFSPSQSASVRISDLDIVLVNDLLFQKAWDDLRHEERFANRLSDVVRYDIYWGRVQNYNIVPRTRVSITVRDLSSALRKEIFKGHKVNVRIYRTVKDLMDYNIRGVNFLKRKTA